MEDVAGDINLFVFLGERIRKKKIWDMSVTEAISDVIKELNELMQNPLSLIFGAKYIDFNLTARHRLINKKVDELRRFVKIAIMEEAVYISKL